MIILAADTTTPFLSVALTEDGKILAETTLDCGRLHAERLLELVDATLASAQRSIEHTDALAISIGPGSFTGVRIGAATFKGLALAARKPLAAVPTLDALAGSVGMLSGSVCVLLDARMHEVYGAVYRYEMERRVKVVEDMVAPVDQVLQRLQEPTLVLGDGAWLYREQVEAHPLAHLAPQRFSAPRAAGVAAEAQGLIAAGAETRPELVVPVYLRLSQPEMLRAQRAAAEAAK